MLSKRCNSCWDSLLNKTNMNQNKRYSAVQVLLISYSYRFSTCHRIVLKPLGSGVLNLLNMYICREGQEEALASHSSSFQNLWGLKFMNSQIPCTLGSRYTDCSFTETLDSLSGQFFYRQIDPRCLGVQTCPFTETPVIKLQSNLGI